MTIKSTLYKGFVLTIFFLLTGCNDLAPNLEDKKELLIFCGITMEKPIRELAGRFEKLEDCTVKIMIGGSGTLYRTITVNQAGDLYLPGSEAYIKKGRENGVITETKHVGYNRAALIVAKGNPLNISANLNNLINEEYKTVLGAPDSGSIGKETKRILTSAEIYEKAIDNSLYLTSDSKGLRLAIVDGVADLTLNWYAPSIWPKNKDKIEALLLDESVAIPHQLIVSLLKFSKEPELAKRFFIFISSETGMETFNRYGFGGK